MQRLTLYECSNPMLRWIRGGLTCLALLISAGHADAVVIDFESVPTGDCLNIGTPLTTQGFTFTTLSSNLYTCDGTRSSLASNGTTTMGSEAFPAQITMSQAGGGAFALLSLDLGELRTSTPPGNRVRVDGVVFGGGSVSILYSLDGINDGAGGLADFETFILPAGFGSLSEVTFNGLHSGGGAQARFLVDNIVATPEPSTLLLLSAGLAGLGLRRRRARFVRGSADRTSEGQRHAHG